MRKAALLYNPLSGRQRQRRMTAIEAVLGVLRAAGVEVKAEPTRGAAESGEQAKQAIASGCDTVLAGGGDGTVHDVLQGIVGTPAALGIIPLGTANALAHDLCIPMNSTAAARAVVRSEPRRFAVGRVEYQDFAGKPGSRYFTVAVGVGIDAHLFYKLNVAMKDRLGMTAYYAKATHLWFTHKMEFFDVEFEDVRTGERRPASISELMAVRIGEFGGMLRELAPGAALANNHMRLVLFRTGNRFRYLQYILRGLLRGRWNVPGIELQDSKRVTCRHLATAILVEADGELVGTLPAEISIVPDAITLLVP
ncbi:MAG TPA: diacylglycerol kinase family protein [Terriglobales bacterium]|nr:diacylglycerol kinase family protein [Terriglobales bacterium]